MTASVESNFVLELALGQEQVDAAEALVELAETGTIDLAIPVFAMSEPFATVVQRGRSLRRLIGQFKEQVRELARSRPHQHDVSLLRPIPDLLRTIELRETSALVSTVERLLQIARPIDLDLTVFQQANRYRERYNLSPQDATIYSTIVGDLTRSDRAEDHFFASKNRDDFGGNEIRNELRALRCTYVDSFPECVHRLRGA